MKAKRSRSKTRPKDRRRSGFPIFALAIALALALIFAAGIAGADGKNDGKKGGGLPLGGEKQIDMSELPMFTRLNPPPPAIMLMMDDSSSMDNEILMTTPNGILSYPQVKKYNSSTGQWEWVKALANYIFDRIVGDYSDDDENQSPQYLDAEARKLWKTRWFERNLIYYNPARDYRPWPKDIVALMPNADPNLPRSNPMRSEFTLNLSDTAFTVGSGASAIKVPFAHYFMYSTSENAPYLVVIDSGIRYYKVTVKLHEAATDDYGKTWWEMVSGLTEINEGNAPPEVKTTRSYIDERQNFANWYSYHRRREFVAKDAIAKLILGLKNVRIGFYGINSITGYPNASSHPILSTLKPVNVVTAGAVQDKTLELLETLYKHRSQGMTPLRNGLNKLGQFFKNNDGKLPGTNLSGAKPFDHACQQAVTLVITDGYYNDFQVQLPAGERNADENNGPPYADSYSDTLADIAMYYYERDLLPALDNLVPPVSPKDVNPGQHMVTYAIAFGVRGELNPDDYVDLKSKADGSWIVWPKPEPGKDSRIDDLWHATVNGRGQFFSVFTPDDLNAAMEALTDAFSNMAKGSASAVAVNGDKISQNSFVYQASFSYEKGEWKGDVNAYKIDSETGQIGTHAWSAEDKLNSTHWDTDRVIATYNSETKQGIPFRESALSNAQKGLLGTNPAEMVSYLRGKEFDSGYRVRTTKLADIVNSGPVHQDGVIYVGANDGMLHAFDAASGEEIFAYVPNLVFHKLKDLASPAYNHRFYVDLTPSVKKGVEITAGQSINLLVGGLRRGGKGYFALNITSAKSIASEDMLKSRVLWEASDANDPDMGYSFCKPIIIKSNSATYPWVVIFGNGYNSVSEKAVLYIMDPKDGFPIRKIEAHAGMDNGLSNALVIDANYDEKADFVYAGDLKGNLWKFDLRDSDHTKWGVAFNKDGAPQPLYQAKGPGGSPQPITTKPDIMYHPEKQGFLVCFGTGKYFTESDFSDTSTQSIYGVWDYGDAVYDLRHKTWSTDDDTEFLGTFTRDDNGPLTNQPPKVGLMQQTPADVDYTVGDIKYTLRLLTDHKPAWKTAEDASGQEPDPSAAETNHAGYYIDLPMGERVITNVIIRGGMLLALAFKPTVDICGSGGDSIFMEINAFTGGRPNYAMFDINRDNKVDASDMVTVTLNDGTSVTVPPVGIKFGGFVETPAIMRLGPTNVAGTEMKYFSSSDGGIHTLAERAPKLGITHWMEVRY
jgi:type IV pilus assembly protein PilY1